MTPALTPSADTSAAAAAKSFATLRARLALAGFTLELTDRGVLIVARGLHHRELRDLDDAEAFARRVGAPA